MQWVLKCEKKLGLPGVLRFSVVAVESGLNQ